MEKQINIPLIDCIAELTNKQIAGLGDGFIDMNTDIAIDDETIAKAKELKKQKEDFLKQQIIINEAKAYLANTDYKMLPNYVPKADEDLDAIIAKRNETREFIRSVENN